MIKLDDVSYVSVTLRPRATCNAEDCPWDFQGVYDKSGTFEKAARQHVATHPTHTVRVIQDVVSEYFLPEEKQANG